ncbi:Retrovirus-related Pol polyprotein from transposon gypsy, partial [Mucuna pruriens]
MVVYFDDILVYFACVDDHDESLYVNLEKCTFFTQEVIFWGFMVGFKGVQVDEKKVKVIQSWPTPTNISNVQSFHELASFYRHFVKDFGTIATPLNEIIKKDVGFKWEEPQEKVFQTLKKRLSNALVKYIIIF